MNCLYFNTCGSCTLPYSYEKQLDIKIKNATNILELNLQPQIFTSPHIHYRNRAEFRIFHDKNRIFFALHSNEKRLFCIDKCPKVDKKIYDLMAILLENLDENLSHKLFCVEFLSSSEKLLITMIYHKKIDDVWLKSAKILSQKLNIKIIGRSRGVKLVVSDDFVEDELTINNKKYTYSIFEGAFSQPNKAVNEKMISWVTKQLKNTNDLLELYCGYGNFTIALSSYFNKVLATEISKTSIKSALKNCKLNSVKNISFLRMSVEELVSAFDEKREFFRLKDIDLKNFNFSHVFVDPPRAGLDDKSLEFIKKFENIIYISCNVTSLKRDLESLKCTHEVSKIAFFDQFAYTKHLECGVVLKKYPILS